MADGKAALLPPDAHSRSVVDRLVEPDSLGRQVREMGNFCLFVCFSFIIFAVF